MYLSPSGYNLLAVCMIVLIVLGCGAQFLTLLILLKKENQSKCLTPYLLNIVAANTLMILGSFPSTVASAFANRWIFSEAVCKLIGFFGGCAATAMIATMLCVTLTIHHSVVKQSVTNRVLNQPPDRTQVKIIAAVWIYSVVAMLPPVIGWTEMKHEAADTNCTPDWSPDNTGGLVYIMALTLISYVIPVGGSFFYYLKIRRALNQHMALVIPLVSIQTQLRRFQNITKMSVLAILAFTVTWLPYAVYVMISAFGGSNLFTAASSVIPSVVAKTSILYNPFVYALVNPRFRRSAIEILCLIKARDNAVRSISSTRVRFRPKARIHSSANTEPTFLKSRSNGL